MRVSITTPAGVRNGIMTVFCLISDDGQHPQGVEEGVRLVVPGVVNFNKIVTGANIYFKTS